MKTRWYLETVLYSEHGAYPGAADFLARYGSKRVGPTMSFVFGDEKTVNEAISQLARDGMEADVFYVFELTDEELRDYPALYLGFEAIDQLLVDGTVDSRSFDGYDIAQDLQSKRVVVNRGTRRLLEGICQGLHFAPLPATDGRNLLEMQVTAELPEPIVIPAPVNVGPHATRSGLHTVRSDGRDVLSDPNLALIKAAGMALSHQVQLAERVLRWAPRMLATGSVVHCLRGAAVRGALDHLTPLLSQNHPLSGIQNG